MKRSLAGFATLTSVALLVLLVAYLSIGVEASSQVELGLNHSTTQGRSQAWSTLDGALRVLKSSWDPSRQRFSDWSLSHPVQTLTWESLSGRVNLNTISPFLLGQPGFRDTLGGVTVEKFAELRTQNGPSADPAFYSAMIRPESLRTWYTVHSLWNLNTADEVMLESMAAQRTGTAALGSALRASVRSYRQQVRRIKQEDWGAIIGSSLATLEPLVTLEPELDVNEVSPILLSSLLGYPNLGITEPTIKARMIVEARQSEPLTAEKLKTLLQVQEDNLILSYLGVRTRFLGGSVTTSTGTLGFTIYLDGEIKASPSPRILRAVWKSL